jgi:hypothetical protein
VTATAEATARGAANRRRGLTAERDCAAYLRRNGFPNARRAVVTGDGQRADPGDIAGLPGIIVSVKDTQVERITEWLADLDAMALDDPAALRLLVVKRRRFRPAAWTVHMQAADYAALIDGRQPCQPHMVRLELGDLVPLLRAAGYGGDR